MINKKPAIGRIIFGDSITYDFALFGKPEGVITRISGNRIYYLDKFGKENFLVKFSAVCDTEEEAKMLSDFKKKCVDELRELKRSQENEAKLFFE
jgi:hypothetical protein